MDVAGFSGQFRQRAIACAVITAVHVGLFLLLAAARPQIVQALASVPLEVGFIAEQQRPREQWTPPVPEVAPVTLDARFPKAVSIELATTTSDRAITVSSGQTLPAQVASASGDIPKEVSAVEYIRAPVPRYPQIARRQREQGIVVLRVLIDTSGRVARIEIHQSSGFAHLDIAAREAVEKAAFKPYVENGLVQAAFVLIPIEFSLNSPSARRT